MHTLLSCLPQRVRCYQRKLIISKSEVVIRLASPFKSLSLSCLFGCWPLLHFSQDTALQRLINYIWHLDSKVKFCSSKRSPQINNTHKRTLQNRLNTFLIFNHSLLFIIWLIWCKRFTLFARFESFR